MNAFWCAGSQEPCRDLTPYCSVNLFLLLDTSNSTSLPKSTPYHQLIPLPYTHFNYYYYIVLLHITSNCLHYHLLNVDLRTWIAHR